MSMSDDDGLLDHELEGDDYELVIIELADSQTPVKSWTEEYQPNN